MNTRNLIDSGQIELYVAGVLTADEKRLIDELIVNYPEINTEIKEAEDSWNNFANAYSRNPRPKLRKTIVDLAQKEGAKIHTIDENHKLEGDSSSELKWWLTAVSIGLLIMISGLNVMFYLKWTEAEDKLMRHNSQEIISSDVDSISETIIP